jgi:serine/threonine-protein kinase
VQTLKQLLHPGIVRLHGYGEENGHLYYVMEYVPGRNLQDELSSGRRFQWREVARIGVQIGLALKHAHDRGVVHRDLKPANLLLTDDDQIKLTDFGIAKLYGGTHVTADGSVMGTADYMSPEQARGKNITTRCDLYSLGSVLYALLTGRPPFAGKTLTEVITNLMQEKPVTVRRLAPDTPAELEAIVLQLLEKDPQQRIPTAIAVVNRLKAMEHALSIDTRTDDPAVPNVDSDDFQLQPLDDEPLRSRPTARGSTAAPTVDIGAGGASAVANPGLVPGNVPTLFTGPGPSPLAGVPTQATGRGRISHSAVTNAAEAENGEDVSLTPPLPKATHFTTVSEAELRGKREARDATEFRRGDWLKLIGVIAAGFAAIALIALAVSRKPSANQLAASIQAAVDRDGTDGLLLVEPDLEKFLAYYPNDERVAQMQSHAKELELFRLQKQFERRARRSSEEQGLLPVERLYLQAQRDATADPASALAQFQALVKLLKDDQDPAATALERKAAAQCLALASKQIEQLTSLVEKIQQQQRLLIRRQLARAAELEAKQPAEAAEVRQSIVTLFAGKSWAADLVAEAQGSSTSGP